MKIYLLPEGNSANSNGARLRNIRWVKSTNQILQRVDILTYYTPSDPTKDKEPKLNRGLQKKWLPKKTVTHKQQLEKEKDMRTRNRLMEGPSERAKNRKRVKMEQQKSESYENGPNHILQ